MRTPEALSAQMRVRRAVTLLVLTVLAPGSAQVAAGNRRFGRAAVCTWLVTVGVTACLAVTWFIDRGVVLDLFTRPVLLALAGVLLVAAGCVWPAYVLDAWRLGRSRLLPVRARRWTALLAVTLVALTSFPLIAAGRRSWAAGDLIGGVFSGDDASAAVDGRYNVLLIGSDAGADRTGIRPDTMIVASINPQTGATLLFSLPRNLENVPFPARSAAARAMPNGFACGDACLLNAVYQWGATNPQLFPGAGDPGAEAMKQAVQGVTGLRVNYYVLIDLRGFRRLIDAIGGIEVNVGSKVPIGGGTSPIKGHIEPGVQHLNGYRALWYARSREGSSDYQRMLRQRCVMTAMANQLDPQTVLARFQKIAAAGKGVVSTDIPSGELATFLELGAQAKQRRITSVQFVPPLIRPAYPDFGLIRSTVQRSIDAAEQGRNDGVPAPSAASGSSGGSAGGTPSGGASSGNASTSPGGSASGSGRAGGVDARSVCSAA
jgi:LCP family protein required for cell wall assembly